MITARRVDRSKVGVIKDPVYGDPGKKAWKVKAQLYRATYEVRQAYNQ